MSSYPTWMMTDPFRSWWRLRTVLTCCCHRGRREGHISARCTAPRRRLWHCTHSWVTVPYIHNCQICRKTPEQVLWFSFLSHECLNSLKVQLTNRSCRGGSLAWGRLIRLGGFPAVLSCRLFEFARLLRRRKSNIFSRKFVFLLKLGILIFQMCCQ